MSMGMDVVKNISLFKSNETNKCSSRFSLSDHQWDIPSMYNGSNWPILHRLGILTSSFFQELHLKL